MPSSTGAETGTALIVHGHAGRASLGHRIVRDARERLERRGCEVRLHDLLADGFDPVLRLPPGATYPEPGLEGDDALTARYRQDVRAAELLVIVHPVWWFAPPAVLKGWVDRVLVHGIAIEQREGGLPPAPRLAGRRAVVVQTFKAPPAADRETGRIAERFWRTTLASAGIERPRRLALYRVEELDADRLERFLERQGRVLEGLAGDGHRRR